MSMSRQWQESLILEKSEVFEADREYRTKGAEDRTFFNTQTFENEYKLAQAYANVRILEYRGEGRLEVETFDDYFAQREMIIKARFQAVEKSRPSFPSDEAYLNMWNWRHYRHGEVLVIVDKAIYDDVSTSIHQYILDIGREGYWGTIHVVTGGGPANIRDYIKKNGSGGVSAHCSLEPFPRLGLNSTMISMEQKRVFPVTFITWILTLTGSIRTVMANSIPLPAISTRKFGLGACIHRQ
jgi:hypothetical protein